MPQDGDRDEHRDENRKVCRNRAEVSFSDQANRVFTIRTERGGWHISLLERGYDEEHRIAACGQKTSFAAWKLIMNGSFCWLPHARFKWRARGNGGPRRTGLALEQGGTIPPRQSTQ